MPMPPQQPPPSPPFSLGVTRPPTLIGTERSESENGGRHRRMWLYIYWNSGDLLKQELYVF